MRTPKDQKTAEQLAASGMLAARLATAAAQWAATEAARLTVMSVLTGFPPMNQDELRELAKKFDMNPEQLQAVLQQISVTRQRSFVERAAATGRAAPPLSALVRAVSEEASSQALRSPDFEKILASYLKGLETLITQRPDEVKRPDKTLLEQLLQGVSEAVANELPRRVSTRDLSRNTANILAALHREPRSAVITYRGVPSFLLVPIDRGNLSALLLGTSPQLDADLADAERALEEGSFGEPEPTGEE